VAQTTAEVQTLRRQLRRLRCELPRVERLAAEHTILRRLKRLGVFQPGARVGIYLAVRGEVDLTAAAQHARLSGTRLFAPRITNFRRRTMAFLPLRPQQRLHANAFGIAEPMAPVACRLSVLRLGTVLVPLVGFDRAGHRLGMGAGFYDRALARRRDPRRAWRRPRLIGVAFACQEVDAIQPGGWDVALDAVVTEREVVDCRRSR